MNLFEKQARLNQLFAQAPVKTAYLAGSLTSRASFGQLSDVDIAILLTEQITSDQFLDYQFYFLSELTRRLEADTIDVVILNQASLLLKLQVIKYGQILYSRDEKQRVQFETKAVLDYLDFKKFDEMQSQALSRRLSPRVQPSIEVDLLQPYIRQVQEAIPILKELADDDPEQFSQTPQHYGLADRYLQIVIEACLQICGLLIASQGLRRPEAYHEHLSVIANQKLIPRELAYRLENLVNLRESLVWSNSLIDHRQIHSDLSHYVNDLQSFIESIGRINRAAE